MYYVFYPIRQGGKQGFKNSIVLNGCIGYMDEMLTFL